LSVEAVLASLSGDPVTELQSSLLTQLRVFPREIALEKLR